MTYFNKKEVIMGHFERFVYSFFTVPGGGASNKRRHSFQSGVPGLTKDMDRLKVSPSGDGRSRGASPRASTRRRASTVRRSSRSGKKKFHIFTILSHEICHQNQMYA